MEGVDISRRYWMRFVRKRLRLVQYCSLGDVSLGYIKGSRGCKSSVSTAYCAVYIVMTMVAMNVTEGINERKQCRDLIELIGLVRP